MATGRQAGVIADAYGLVAAVWTVAALTAASGVMVAARMRETLAKTIMTGMTR